MTGMATTTLTPKGLLIAFEGIDGAGKTTQARLLAKHLRELAIDVVESKEPTNGPWGLRLRQSAQTGRLPPIEELELFIQDRRGHVQELITPAIDAGKVVIVDRYYFSTAAYQGARGMDFRAILAQNEEFAPQPDILFILRVPPELGRARIASRGDVANHFEDEEKLAASAAIFDQIERPYARHLNGGLPIHELENTIIYAAWNAIEPRIPRELVGSCPYTPGDACAEAERVLADGSIPTEAKAQALLARLARS